MKIKINELKDMCIRILMKKWLNKNQAQQVFDEYLDGEMRGRECHGFQAFPKFDTKNINLKTKPKIIYEKDNVFYIDWNKNLGLLLCHFAWVF